MKKAIILAAATLLASSTALAGSKEPNINVQNSTNKFTLIVNYTTPGDSTQRILTSYPHSATVFHDNTTKVAIQSLVVMQGNAALPFAGICGNLQRGQLYNGVSIKVSSIFKTDGLKPVVACTPK